jgi:hypothetical protein
VIHVAIHAAEAKVPIAVDLTETAGHVLARLLRALGLDEVVSSQRIAFFLLHEGMPLEVDDTLAAAGVGAGDQLELGLYTFLIE